MKKPHRIKPASIQSLRKLRYIKLPHCWLTPEMLEHLGANPLVLDLKRGPVRRKVKLR